MFYHRKPSGRWNCDARESLRKTVGRLKQYWNTGASREADLKIIKKKVVEDVGGDYEYGGSGLGGGGRGRRGGRESLGRGEMAYWVYMGMWMGSSLGVKRRRKRIRTSTGTFI
jgi:hypothetical protein